MRRDRQRFGGDAARRQLDVKLGQLAFFGHSMLGCGLSPSEVRTLVCSMHVVVVMVVTVVVTLLLLAMLLAVVVVAGIHGREGGALDIMHGRSRMTVDPRIPTVLGRSSTSGFHRPG